MRSAITSIVLLSCGLWGCEDSSLYDQTYRQATAEVTGGMVSWSIDGDVAEGGFDAEGDTEPLCDLLYQSNFPNSDQHDASTLFGPWLECVTDQGYLDILLPELGDLRALEEGTTTFTPEDDEFPLVYFSWGSTVCELMPEGVEATREVTEATGAAEPYPDLVSADYRRVFRVSFDTGDATGELRDDSGSCSGSVSVDVEIEQAPEHYLTQDLYAEAE